ncbi:MAG: hypothetical protein APF76_06115 [Desulfitibacter sp. BRH_c19]|nr:MAG: hypothetical protein APF76_06115 [Desulfitibacter sp. BRH_c19]
MAKFTFEGQPRLKLLSDSQIEKIHDQAIALLEKTGVKFDSEEALKILEEHGATIDYNKRIAKIPGRLVEKAIKTAPEEIKLFNRQGELSANLSGSNVYFDPGSCAIRMMASDGITTRSSQSHDLIKISKVTDALDNLVLQSSAVTPYDVPKIIGDSFRLYLLLKNSPKAIITGAFTINGVSNMRDMLAVVRGGYKELEEKPLAVFDICASPPLKWTHISSQNIIDCARYGLPQEFITMAMPGAASPATLAGSVLVQVTETLSGLTLAQCTKEGAPCIYGSAPVSFDMRHGTTPMSALEATMIGAAYVQMGKYYGLPTHTYAGLSDSKLVDVQAGLETAMSGIIAQLAGINVISGAGILDFVGCFSLEKLVIDNEICGMALRLNEGIRVDDETLAVDLISELGPGGDYLLADHTLRWYKKEPYLPSKVIVRNSNSSWEAEGSKGSFTLAQEKVKDILENHVPVGMNTEQEKELDNIVRGFMKEHDIKEIPNGPIL